MRLTKEEIWWINKHVSMEDYMEMYGHGIHENGQCLCPFHENVDTPAAKFFPQSNSLFCFAEHRTYRSYNLLRLHGWDEDKFRQLLPEDFEYSPEDVNIVVPVVPKDLYEGVSVYGLLARLRALWLNREREEVQTIKLN